MKEGICIKTLDGPTITPHADAAEIAIARMTEVMAERCRKPGMEGMSARFIVAFNTIFVRERSRERDLGVSQFDCDTATCVALSNLIAGAVLQAVSSQPAPIRIVYFKSMLEVIANNALRLVLDEHLAGDQTSIVLGNSTIHKA